MFIIHHCEKGDLPALEAIQAGGGSSSGFSVTVGKALAMAGASGAQTCPATAKPQYIAMQAADIPMMGRVEILAVPVDSLTVYETTFSASGAGLGVGDKVTLSADGTQVTGTTTDGTATIVALPDGVSTAGAKVLVKFM